mgnify:CR=1 FL=1
METYRAMRVQDQTKGGDAPEYEEYCKDVERQKKKAKLTEKISAMESRITGLHDGD